MPANVNNRTAVSFDDGRLLAEAGPLASEIPVVDVNAVREACAQRPCLINCGNNET